MWIITKEDSDDFGPDILSDDEGNPIIFDDKVAALRYLELLCNDFNITPDEFVKEQSIIICRLH